MKVLLITHAYPPEIRSTSQLMFELSEDLRRRGHEVTVITPLPRYNLSEIPEKYRGKFYIKERENNITVMRIATLPIHLVGPVKRGVGYVFISLAFFLLGLLSKRQDVILTYSTPFTLGLSSYLIGRIKRIPFVFNVQDLFPQNAIDLGLLGNSLLIKLFERLETFLYEKAEFITVHSEGNKNHVISKGAHHKSVHIIYNWVDTEILKPLGKHNKYRMENKLDSSFIVLFAGVMGYAQDLDTIIESAYLLRDHQDISFLLVGDGVEKERLIQKALSLNLRNVIFLPFVPMKEYPKLVSASDLCLATLRKTMRTPVVPSKILGIMAGGRPIVGGLPLDGDAPKIIEAAHCGYCVEPENPEQLSQAILKLYNDPSLGATMGQNGRQYAERHFSRTLCTREYEELFSEACRSYGIRS